MRTETEILLELNEITSKRNFLDVLLVLTHKNLNSFADELMTRNLRNVLNENEITFLFGLWVKNKNNNLNEITEIDKTSQKIHDLMNELHTSFVSSINLSLEKSFYENSVNDSHAIKETIFYAGTGAYDYQYCDFIENKYKYDNDWLQKRNGFRLKNAVELFNYIKSILNYKLNTKNNNQLKDIYTIDRNNYVFKKNPTWIKILDLFSFETDDILNKNFTNIGDLNEFKFKPVIKNENKYFIPIPYLLAEAMYDSPYYWMLEDDNYKNVALKNRGNVAEEIVRQILTKKIDEKNIFQNVLIKINKNKTLSDIDICVVQGEKVLVFQVKSKRLNQLSKKGDINQFHKDFKQAVSNAFEQAKISENAVLSNQYKLIEKETGRIIETHIIKEVYSVCIVLDNYASITTHTRMFYYETEHELPIALSIFDLDVIVNYITDFEMLFDYIKQRTKNSKYFIADNELTFFSNYLKVGLKKNPKYDITALDTDFAQYFDSDFYLPLMQKYQEKANVFINGIQRNDFCFCGSGRKFKKCCMKELIKK